MHITKNTAAFKPARVNAAAAHAVSPDKVVNTAVAGSNVTGAYNHNLPVPIHALTSVEKQAKITSTKHKLVLEKAKAESHKTEKSLIASSFAHLIRDYILQKYPLDESDTEFLKFLDPHRAQAGAFCEIFERAKFDIVADLNNYHKMGITSSDFDIKSDDSVAVIANKKLLLQDIRTKLDLQKFIPLKQLVPFLSALQTPTDQEPVDFEKLFQSFELSDEMHQLLRTTYDVKDKFLDDYISSQSDHSSRSIVELGSNAIDASTSGNGSKPIVDIAITDKGYLVKDRGSGMNGNIISKLLIPTLSGKLENSDGKFIGRFGVGFYTALSHLKDTNDTVQITTNTGNEAYKICFQKRKELDGAVGVSIQSIAPNSVAKGTSMKIDSASFDKTSASNLLQELMQYNPRADIRLHENNKTEIINKIENFDEIPCSSDGKNQDTRILVSKEKNNDYKCQVSILINGVKLTSKTVEGLDLPKEIVLDYPSSCDLPESRSDLSIDSNSVDASIAIISGLKDSNLDTAIKNQIFSGLYSVFEEFQSHNPKRDEEHDMVKHLRTSFKEANIEDDRFVPNDISLSQLQSSDLQKIHPGLLEGMDWTNNFEICSEFKSNDYVLCLGDFKDKDTISIESGRVIFLNREIYEAHKNKPGLLNLYFSDLRVGNHALDRTSTTLNNSYNQDKRGELQLTTENPKAHITQSPQVSDLDFNGEPSELVLNLFGRDDAGRCKQLLERYPNLSKMIVDNILKPIGASTDIFTLQALLRYTTHQLHQNEKAIQDFANPPDDAKFIWDSVKHNYENDAARAEQENPELIAWFENHAQEFTKKVSNLSKQAWISKLNDCLDGKNISDLGDAILGTPNLHKVNDSDILNLSASKQQILLGFIESQKTNLSSQFGGIDDYSLKDRLNSIFKFISETSGFDDTEFKELLTFSLSQGLLEKTHNDIPSLQGITKDFDQFNPSLKDQFDEFIHIACDKIYSKRSHNRTELTKLMWRMKSLFINKFSKMSEADVESILGYMFANKGLSYDYHNYLDYALNAGDDFDLSKLPRAIRPYLTYIHDDKKKIEVEQSSIDIEPNEGSRMKLSDLVLHKELHQSETLATETDPQELETKIQSFAEDKDTGRIRREICHSVNNQSVNDNFIWLREMAQNSIDALYKAGISNGEVAFSAYKSEDNSSAMITSVKDDVGMSFADVINYVLIPGESSKRDDSEQDGKYGQGFFTVFKGAKEVRLKTSNGDGNVSYFILRPLNSEGELIKENEKAADFSIEYTVKAEDFKGTVIEQEREVDDPDFEHNMVQSEIVSKLGLVDANKVGVSWQGIQINKPIEHEISFELEGLGTLRVNDSQEQALTRKGLYVKDIDGEFWSAIPNSLGSLLKQTGFSIDLPMEVELVRSRNEFRDKETILPLINKNLSGIAMKLLVEKTAKGALDLCSFEDFPYDFFQSPDLYEPSNNQDLSIENLSKIADDTDAIMKLLIASTKVSYGDTELSLSEFAKNFASDPESFEIEKLPSWMHKHLQRAKDGIDDQKRTDQLSLERFGKKGNIVDDFSLDDISAIKDTDTSKVLLVFDKLREKIYKKLGQSGVNPKYYYAYGTEKAHVLNNNNLSEILGRIIDENYKPKETHVNNKSNIAWNLENLKDILVGVRKIALGNVDEADIEKLCFSILQVETHEMRHVEEASDSFTHSSSFYLGQRDIISRLLRQGEFDLQELVNEAVQECGFQPEEIPELPDPEKYLQDVGLLKPIEKK